MNEIWGILFTQSTWLAWPNQLAAKVRVRFMVMVWLDGWQGEVRGTCDPPPPPTPNHPTWTPQPPLPTPPPPITPPYAPPPPGQGCGSQEPVIWMQCYSAGST